MALVGCACMAGGAAITTSVYTVSSVVKDRITGSNTSKSDFNAGLVESAYRGVMAGAIVFSMIAYPPARAVVVKGIAGGGTAIAASTVVSDTLISVIPQVSEIVAVTELTTQGVKAMMSEALSKNGGEVSEDKEGVYIEEGEGESWLEKENGVVDPKSTKNFGHTFTTHGSGEKNTKALLDRARGTNTPQGQWLNNQEAANYLNKYGKIEYSQPPKEIPIPDGLGQVIFPDGSIKTATKCRVVINKATGKIRSAIPIFD